MKYKKWDKVRVRTWDDMGKEYWKRWLWVIDTDIAFTTHMREYCWKIVEITEVNIVSYYIEWDYDYAFSDDMLEPVEAVETFQEGEVVEVRDDYEDEWKEYIYLTTIPWNANYKYYVVDCDDEEEYKAWEEFGVVYYKQIRKLQPKPIKEYTMKQLIEKLWEEFKLIK